MPALRRGVRRPRGHRGPRAGPRHARADAVHPDRPDADRRRPGTHGGGDGGPRRRAHRHPGRLVGVRRIPPRRAAQGRRQDLPRGSERRREPRTDAGDPRLGRRPGPAHRAGEVARRGSRLRRRQQRHRRSVRRAVHPAGLRPAHRLLEHQPARSLVLGQRADRRLDRRARRSRAGERTAAELTNDGGARSPKGTGPAGSVLLRDRDLDVVDAGGRRAHGDVTVAAAGQRADLPVAGRGEETEVTGAGGDDLGGELTGAVEQAHEGAADRLAVGVDDTAGQNRLLLDVDAGGQGLGLNGCTTHGQRTSNSIGAPTSEPYSTQLPS
ncbi:hypothetical protein RHRU231_770016 [Rhodococcus ruber]|uniref:Uncharacterized protein n=1 Tax=Rhodococcus ruber TaxID=1830 RepID=A0A098BRR4_9NOCA|nr:hypothetical protein RHRU231_770016 [Rhodococcus ruber]